MRRATNTTTILAYRNDFGSGSGKCLICSLASREALVRFSGAWLHNRELLPLFFPPHEFAEPTPCAPMLVILEVSGCLSPHWMKHLGGGFSPSWSRTAQPAGFTPRWHFTACSPAPAAILTPSRCPLQPLTLLCAVVLTADIPMPPQGTHLDQQTSPAVTGLQKKAIFLLCAPRDGTVQVSGSC